MAVRAVVLSLDLALTVAVLDVRLVDLEVLVDPIGAWRVLMQIIIDIPDLVISG